MSVQLSPDEHVQELTKLADHFELAVKHWKRDGLSETHGIAALYSRRAAAIRWVLALNAYGVEAHEVVT